MILESRFGYQGPEQPLNHLSQHRPNMFCTSKPTLDPARNLRRVMRSTLESVPRPHISKRLAQEALRRGKHRDQPKVAVKGPDMFEQQFGFSFLRCMPNSDALVALRSQLGVALPVLDRMGSSYNAAIDAHAPERFQLLRDTYRQLHSIHAMTATYATFAEDALGTPGQRVTAGQLTALSNILDEMGTELDRLWPAVQATQHVLQARSSSLSNDSEISESLVN